MNISSSKAFEFRTSLNTLSEKNSGPTIRLYHFTSISYLKQIKREGLTKGQMQTSINTFENAPNFTTDSTGKGHDLHKLKFASPSCLASRGIRLKMGEQVPVFPDKTKVRITLRLPRRMVTRWTRWALKHVTKEVRDYLIRTGGGMRKARTWYFSNSGPVSPVMFEEIEVWDNGRWVRETEYLGPRTEVLTKEALVKGYSMWGHQLRAGRDAPFLEQLNEALHDHCSEA